MLDIKLIRSNPEQVKAAAKKREFDADQMIEEILKIVKPNPIFVGLYGEGI